ncbi:hypothetical protein DL96DRAFT_1713394 [Flagelloscypha sp. PMI_526]|nr:hypothetical protein DL96DRAFT_1713394 [Flagelloscypha sp. PMI_526]
MPTPRAGTMKHDELRTLYAPYSRPKVDVFIDGWLIPIAWLFLVAVVIAAYNVGVCALGRFFLDHFHLWNRGIPSSASSRDKHAELFAVLLAGCLSFPIFLALTLASLKFEVVLERRGRRVEILDTRKAVALQVFINWIFVPVSGAIIHPRYQYTNPISILGVYWFGNLVLLPLSVPLAWFGYWLLRD